MALEQDKRISEVVQRERSRLHNFIRRRVPDPRDAEDILQEVFYELVEANRLLMPIEHVTGWMLNMVPIFLLNIILLVLLKKALHFARGELNPAPDLVAHHQLSNDAVADIRLKVLKRNTLLLGCLLQVFEGFKVILLADLVQSLNQLRFPVDAQFF